MRPLSIDLRERIVGAYRNQEGSYTVLAARFSVSLKRHFDCSIEPVKQHRGRPVGHEVGRQHL